MWAVVNSTRDLGLGYRRKKVPGCEAGIELHTAETW